LRGHGILDRVVEYAVCIVGRQHARAPGVVVSLGISGGPCCTPARHRVHGPPEHGPSAIGRVIPAGEAQADSVSTRVVRLDRARGYTCARFGDGGRMPSNQGKCQLSETKRTAFLVGLRSQAIASSSRCPINARHPAAVQPMPKGRVPSSCHLTDAQLTRAIQSIPINERHQADAQSISAPRNRRNLYFPKPP